MELQESSISFVHRDGSASRPTQWACKVLLVDFKTLLSSSAEQSKLQTHTKFSALELLHGCAGVCSVCLPDMEIGAIYNSLTAQSCTTATLLTSPQSVLDYRLQRGVPASPVDGSASGKANSSKLDESTGEEEGDSNPFSLVVSDGESSSEEEEGDGESSDHPYTKQQDTFIQEAMNRQTNSNQHSLDSIGAEHCVLGCASFLRLSTGKLDTSTSAAAVQITLLAVRKKNRRLGIGRYLMQLSKDPAVVGHYNALLAFADHKAEGFFSRHGFSDDPMLTAKYRSIADHWENSTLMVYMPPFSEGGLAVGSIKSLTNFQDHYQKWRDTAISGYCIQLGMMERLRHELLLLHNKVQSQEELISVLSQQLREARQEKASLQLEFNHYRKHSQRLLREAAISQAEDWITKETLTNNHQTQENSHSSN